MPQSHVILSIDSIPRHPPSVTIAPYPSNLPSTIPPARMLSSVQNRQLARSPHCAAVKNVSIRLSGRVRAPHAAHSAGQVVKAPQHLGACEQRCTRAPSAAMRRSRVELVRPIRVTQQEEALCTSSVEEGEDLVELEIKVDGMMCGGCTSRVHDKLKNMEHVRAVNVSLESSVASIEVQAETMIDALNMMPTFVDAIRDLGFEAEPTISLHPGEEYQ